jgi:excisionase family DNA binding protein
MEKLFLRPKEAAEVVGLGRTRFYELVRAGIIPSCRIGKSLRIPTASLRAWAEALAGQPQAPAKSV